MEKELGQSEFSILTSYLLWRQREWGEQSEAEKNGGESVRRKEWELHMGIGVT